MRIGKMQTQALLLASGKNPTSKLAGSHLRRRSSNAHPPHPWLPSPPKLQRQERMRRHRNRRGKQVLAEAVQQCHRLWQKQQLPKRR